MYTCSYWHDQKAQQQLINVLRAGDIAICSTDTVYGFLGNLTAECYDKIERLKENVENRPFLILIASVEKLTYFVDEKDLSNRIKKFLKKCWPGPVTVIFKAKAGLPAYMVSHDGTIALRVPDHVGLLAVLPEFNGLFSTSANKHGKLAPSNLEDLDKAILKKVSFVIADRIMGKAINSNLPSSIIDLSQDSFRVVRQGAYSIEELKEMYEQD